jgi:hypothetical protein
MADDTGDDIDAGGGWNPASGGSSTSGGLGSATDWSSIVSGLYGLTQNSANSATLADANAFNKYRPAYSAQLAALIQNPSSVTSDPGFQAGLGQATNQVQHSLASQGLIGGGTMAGTISNTANQYTDTYLNNQETMLANLAGAWINPNQTYASQTNSTSSALGGMSSLFSGIGGLFGSSSGGSSGGGFLSSIGSLFGG